MTQPLRVCVIGLWHQGVVGAACLADLGYDVLGADHDADRVEELNRGRAPLFEPGLDALLQKGLAAGRLRFTADVGAAVKGRRDILLMFDTPVDDSDRSDVAEVLATAAEIAPNLEEDSVILVTAQVPVGTCDRIRGVIVEQRPSAGFGVAYSPENLRLGQAIDRFLRPPLPVVGAGDSHTGNRVEQLLSPLNVKWERTDLRTAEMVKHALNAFLATSVSFANELGNVCDEVGADGRRLGEILRMEPRIGPKAMLFPGLGFSGGTLARDLQTLRRIGDETGLDTLLLDGVWESNRRQNGLVKRKLLRALGSLKNVPLAVWGLTYKPDTSTLRRSSALEIIADLVQDGAVVRAHDPKADRQELDRHREFVFCEDVYETVRGAQAAILITGWSEYRAVDFARVRKLMAGSIILDTNNMLDAAKLVSLGFMYMGIGRGRAAG